jgi:gentisate 1,2-dioxygenase
MQRLPAGFAGKAWRQTDGAVYSVVEGSGEVVVSNGQDSASSSARATFRDSVVAHCPACAGSGCVLFSFSDRPVHQALGIQAFLEERLS